MTDHYFQQIMQWAEKYKHTQVMANGCSADDVKVAIAIGAEGVGSFEMKSLFFSTLQQQLPQSMDPSFGSTITSSSSGESTVAAADLVREKMLTTCKDTRARIIRELRCLLTQQLTTVFKACPNREITCRLADPNLQDFFPNIHSATFEADVLALSFRLKMDPVHCLRVVRSLHEDIPSMGYKGARQAVMHPQICLMQCRAIMGKNKRQASWFLIAA
jgi:phosphoenolpyruvate synthase/pyruvate phosphate dikinase